MKQIQTSVNNKQAPSRVRHYIILIVFFLGTIVLLTRAVNLQHYQSSYLQKQGHDRQIKTVHIPAHRGEITDRFGNPLAISTPVYSVWIDPQHFDLKNIDKVAQLPGVNQQSLYKRIKQAEERRFLYVKRHFSPSEVSHLYSLGLTGLHFKMEYRRFYPTGEVSSHVVGTTNIDDKGQESIEKVMDEILRSKIGKKRVVSDRYNRAIEQFELVEPPVYGSKVALSIDQRIQYRTYRALKNAVQKHNAGAGSAVVIDVKTGEILAMVNQPSFNPNKRNSYDPKTRRNRSLTDMFEPGSTIKPFVIATLIENQPEKIDMTVDTSPGYYRVSGNKIEDIRNFGVLDLPGIVIKSSNVGISKVAAILSKESLWKTFDLIGFGHIPGTGFLGETSGRLHDHAKWNEIDQVVMSYGYGIAVSLVQLVNSYSVFANDGWQPSLSFVKGNPYFEKKKVFRPQTARYIRNMLQRVTLSGGTGRKARVDGYSIAGKTGTTVRKLLKDGAEDTDYLSLFVGFVPATAPRLVAGVMIDNPRGKQYYGGDVAAPVFAEVMTQALRLLDTPRDEPISGKFQDAKAFKRVSR